MENCRVGRRGSPRRRNSASFSPRATVSRIRVRRRTGQIGQAAFPGVRGDGIHLASLFWRTVRGQRQAQAHTPLLQRLPVREHEVPIEVIGLR